MENSVSAMKPGATTFEVIPRTLVTAGAISQRVARAEQAGLVARRSETDGSRAVLVSLTDAGHDLVEPIAHGYAYMTPPGPLAIACWVASVCVPVRVSASIGVQQVRGEGFDQVLPRG